MDSLLNKRVTIKKEYQNPDEENVVYTVVEDNGDRLYIQPYFSNLHVIPTELVRRDHVQIYLDA